MHYIIKKTKLENCLVILKLGCFSGWFWIGPSFILILILPSKAQILFKKAKKWNIQKMVLKSQIYPLIKSFAYFMKTRKCSKIR